MLHTRVVIHLCLADTGNETAKGRPEVLFLDQHVDVLWSCHFREIILGRKGIRMGRVAWFGVEFGYAVWYVSVVWS